MTRPLIGICAGFETARWGAVEMPALVSPRSYPRAVHDAGGLAVVIPPQVSGERTIDRLLEALDGVVLAGGGDLDPAVYGESPHPGAGPASIERDSFEIDVALASLAHGLPLLGICRGMEIMNVALGGTLVQHLDDEHGTHRHAPGVFSDHEVRVKPGSVLARIAGALRLSVRSLHHQGLGRIGEGLEVSAWSTEDKLPEAVERDGDEFAVGVLWHPEETDGDSVVRGLVDAARESRGRHGR